MTNSPNGGQPSDPPGRGRSRRIWRWVGWGIGGSVLVGGTAGGFWLWGFVNRDLAPLVARQMANLVDRPVEIQNLETISLTTITFGAATLPPTSSDRDQIEVEQIVVSYDLLEVLFRQRLSLDVTLVNPRAFIDQTSEGQWISTQFGNEDDDEPDRDGPIKVVLDRLLIRNGELVLAPSSTVRAEGGKPEVGNNPGARALVAFSDVNGELRLRDDNQTVLFDLRLLPQSGGRARLTGDLRLDQQLYTLSLRSRNLSAADVSSLVAIPVTLEEGQLFSNLTVVIQGNTLKAMNGQVRVRNGIALVQDVPQALRDVNGQVRFQGQRISIQNSRLRYGEIPIALRGDIDLKDGFDLTAQAENVAFDAIQRSVDFDLPIPVVGNFDIQTTVGGAIDDPDVAGQVQTRGPVRVDRVNVASARTTFDLDIDEDGSLLRLPEVRAVLATGGTLEGGGQVALGDQGQVDLTFQARDIAGDPIARAYGANLSDRLRLGNAAADIAVRGPLDRVQTQIQWQALEGTYPARGEILIAGGDINFRDTSVQVAGGTLTGAGTIANSRFEAAIRARDIPLGQFSPQLQGLLTSDVRLSGDLRQPSLQGLRATGTVGLSQGVPFLERPLTVSFNWLGDRLQINQASAPGLAASGTVFANLTGSPSISRFDLAVDLADYDLARFQEFLPSQVQVAGLGSFSGRVSGTPSAPAIAGQLRLADLAINSVTFDPVLRGPVNLAVGQGGRVDLVGAEDRIFAEVNARYRPTQFLIRQGDTVAQGQGEGDRLTANLVNFPLVLLNLSPLEGVGLVQGSLDGDVTVNLTTLAATGQFAIDDPALGYIRGNSLRGQFRYADGSGVLQNTELLLGSSRFLLNGSVTTGENFAYRADIVADDSYVQDILTALHWYEFEDISRGIRGPAFGTAMDVATVAVGDPTDSLLNQLRRLAEIQALQTIQEQEAAQQIQLPSLSELQGPLVGTISLTGSAQTGATAEFDLNGENWVWGDYQVDQVVAEGSFSDGVVTLLPLRIQANETAFLNISGQFGGENQDGQVVAEAIPVERLRDLLNIPLDVTGNLDANVLVSGSLENPLARGTLILNQGTINQKNLDRARTSFSYADARLSFIGEAAIPDAEPLRVLGSIPYQFPFMAVEPDSDAITLNARVEDDGLALLSLFTNQVSWEGGEGVVDLSITGTLYEPQIVGTARFNNGVISALTLPEPLTNVTGLITFDRRLVNVESLQGQFRQGRVVAQGILPIFDANASADPSEDTVAAPLTVALNEVVLNFKGLYRGGVNGQVQLLGTALAPIITGNIVLSNGQVELGSHQAEGVPSGGSAAPSSGPTQPPRLQELLITLGDRLRITQNPILNFVARGDLTINGTPNDLRPNGEIRLRSGQVNLFTTQFGLVRGYNNVARFQPNRGLDPQLDVRLVTSVPEVRRVPVAPSSPFAAAEISETLVTDIGSVGTVRVEARVQGPASQLAESLELTSSPARSEAEIISLLGGNITNYLAEGDGTLAIANFAGSAILTQVQNTITRFLGITDFRLYPTVLPNDTSSGSTLELASELGVDITGQFSTSVLAILTTEAPVQLNLRYRLTDQLLLRGYVDTDGGNGAILEFETRF